MLTKQEIYDKGVGGVLDQGDLCYASGDAQSIAVGCAYTNNDTARPHACVIGHLLPDDETRKHWDLHVGAVAGAIANSELNTNVRATVIRDLSEAGVPTDTDTLDFLVKLQGTHDHATDFGDFVERAKLFAVTHQLSDEVLVSKGFADACS